MKTEQYETKLNITIAEAESKRLSRQPPSSTPPSRPPVVVRREDVKNKKLIDPIDGDGKLFATECPL